MVKGRPEPDPALVARVARLALALPEAYEEDAWTGVRWRIRQRTFGHVMMTTPDRAADYYGLSLAAPVPLLTFRSSGEELLALVSSGPPFLKPDWAPTVVALMLCDDTDWDEVGELLTESYRLLAPQKLARLLP